MSHQLYGVFFLFGFSLIISGLTVGMCYAWLRTVHSPLRVYQRKMLCYVSLLMAPRPILAPLWMASAYWLMPSKPSAAVAIVLFLIWGLVAFQIMRRMSEPRSHSGEEQADGPVL
jgi:hypothetical protein